jgi:hypothetical protein
MSAIATAIVALLTNLPKEVSAIEAFYTTIKGALSGSDTATLDAVFAVLNPKVNADLATLQADAAAD